MNGFGAMVIGALFRKLGFIDYNGGLKINNSLLSVVLRDWRVRWLTSGAVPP